MNQNYAILLPYLLSFAMAFFDKQEAYLGIDIGAHGIKLVELKKTKGRPQLWTYGMLHHPIDIHPLSDDVTPAENPSEGVPLQTLESAMDKKKESGESGKQAAPTLDEERINEYAELLKAVVAQSKATSRRATASLPVSYVFHAVITLPKIDEKELDHHVRAKVKKMLPMPIDEMQVVHQVIPQKGEAEKNKFVRVLVTAAPKYLVSFYSAIFQKAGLQLEELETEAFAIERSLVGNDPATVMLIDVGAERTNFFMVDQGLPITHRSINLGGNAIDKELVARLGIEKELVSQFKIDMSRGAGPSLDSAMFEALIDPIVKEIQYSVDLFIHQTGNEGKRLDKIVLTGGGAMFPPISDILSRAFGVNVFIGDPWARVVYQQGMKQVLDDIGPRMSVSIGLAMRNIV